MYDNIYNISLPRFVVQLLPVRRRKPRMVHWLLCLIAPAEKLLGQFHRYRDQKIYELEHTAQVFSLEDVLNDAFDRSQRRIYIEDGEYTFPVWFYDRASDKPVYFHDRADDEKVRFYDRASLAQTDVDFTVILPIGLNLSQPEMIRLRALIDFYRLPDKTYQIRQANG